MNPQTAQKTTVPGVGRLLNDGSKRHPISNAIVVTRVEMPKTVRGFIVRPNAAPQRARALWAENRKETHPRASLELPGSGFS